MSSLPSGSITSNIFAVFGSPAYQSQYGNCAPALRYFVAVAEELHFGRAAARLHVAQPPLSQQIRKLEELLGYPLFTRTSRSVSLTTAGEALLQRSQRTLRNVQRDIDETRSIGHGDVGSLHIGFIG